MAENRWELSDDDESSKVIPFPKNPDIQSMTGYAIQKAYKVHTNKNFDTHRNLQARLAPWQWKWIDEMIYKERRFQNPAELTRFLVSLGSIVYELSGDSLLADEMRRRIEMERTIARNNANREFIESVRKELADSITRDDALNKLDAYIMAMDRADPFYRKLRQLQNDYL